MKWDSIICFELLKRKIRSTKFEMRNNFKIRIFQLFKQVSDFGHLIFGFAMSVFWKLCDHANYGTYSWYATQVVCLKSSYVKILTLYS
jgi:hypothetical protein